MWICCMVKQVNHAHIKCVRFASWSLPKLLTSLLHTCMAFLLACQHLCNVFHYIYGACYSEVMWRSSKMWASGVAKWRGLLGGCARKFLFVLGATPNFVLSPKLCIERENFVFVWENNLGVLRFEFSESVLTPFVLSTFVSEISPSHRP